jgi:hypothetical protein
MVLQPKPFPLAALAAMPPLLLAGAGILAPVDAQAASSKYCSPTGDFCHGWTRRDGPVRLFLTTFSFRGKVRVCVTAPDATSSCRRFTLRRDKYDIYTIDPRWRGNFPDAGTGTYQATFSHGGARLGRAVSLFIRT